MKENIMLDLFGSGIHEELAQDCPNNIQLLEKADKCYRRLEKCLTKKELKHLDAYVKADAKVDCTDYDRIFTGGFRLGALLMLEILQDR